MSSTNMAEFFELAVPKQDRAKFNDRDWRIIEKVARSAFKAVHAITTEGDYIKAARHIVSTYKWKDRVDLPKPLQTALLNIHAEIWEPGTWDNFDSDSFSA